MAKLRVKCSKGPLLTVTRSSQWKKRMVYILVANRSYKYPSGRKSHIVYVGTTGAGAGRPAASAVDKASQAFSELRGVKRIDVHIATCSSRQSVKTWHHLESALLATFMSLYWKLPVYNKKKGSIRFVEEIDYFRAKALEKVLLSFAP